jgi:hypothetical protein
MADQGNHCPFLNRADGRCSTFFSLDRLDHAFEYCFGEYQQCPVYLELLVERRVRRMTGSCDGSSPLVQITLAHRYKQPAAGASGVAVASGV